MIRRIFFNSYADELRVGWILAIICACISGLVALGLGIGYPISAGYGKSYCSQYASKWNRQTKFVRYSFWSWDCLTRTDTGEWIPTDQLRITVPQQ